MKVKLPFFGLIAVCIAAGGLLVNAQSGKTLGDEDISLRKADMMKMTTAPKVVYEGKDPGENKKLARAFFGAPPMIPHSLADQVVSNESNDCLDCHGDADEDTPGLPPSHRIKPQYKDWSRARAKDGMVTTLVGFGKAEVVSGTRYNCMLCHAPQVTGSPSLVDNDFVPVEPEKVQKDVLDRLNSVGEY